MLIPLYPVYNQAIAAQHSPVTPFYLGIYTKTDIGLIAKHGLWLVVLGAIPGHGHLFRNTPRPVGFRVCPRCFGILGFGRTCRLGASADVDLIRRLTMAGVIDLKLWAWVW